MMKRPLCDWREGRVNPSVAHSSSLTAKWF
jgi:hypothetical protein